MNSRMLNVLYILFLALTAVGCQYFTPPLDQPVIEEKLNPRWLKPGTVGTLSLTPERRVVLVNFTNNKFCAEAPSETGLASNQLRQLIGNVDKGDLSAALSALAATSRNNTILNRRSQGIQLFLASAYFGCQMYMNEAISGEDLVELQIELTKAVAPMISKEVDLMYLYGAQDPTKNEVDSLEKLTSALSEFRASLEKMKTETETETETNNGET